MRISYIWTMKHLLISKWIEIYHEMTRNYYYYYCYVTGAVLRLNAEMNEYTRIRYTIQNISNYII